MMMMMMVTMRTLDEVWWTGEYDLLRRSSVEVLIHRSACMQQHRLHQYSTGHEATGAFNEDGGDDDHDEE